MKLNIDQFSDKLFQFATKMSIIIDDLLNKSDGFRIEFSKVSKNIDDTHNIHKCLIDILESLSLLKIVLTRLVNRSSRLVKLLKKEEQNGNRS